MILYHGSNMIINEIDLNKCRPYKDFGQGFIMENSSSYKKSFMIFITMKLRCFFRKYIKIFLVLVLYIDCTRYIHHAVIYQQSYKDGFQLILQN